VLEEAPSSFITLEVRKRMGEQAVALAKQVGYHSAGTVEFLVDKHSQHYFLEMNTRLQVEHPVTEFVTGLDLVELMIRVAEGEPLPFSQAEVKCEGWALESRVYAEDPLRGFLPSTGRLEKYEEPSTAAVRAALAETEPDVAASGIVRCDSGVREWSEITMHYDPMISKLVTHGKDRLAAISLMRAALDTYVINGLAHNVNFLREMMDHPRFLSGDIDTKLIEVEFKGGYKGYAPSEPQRRDLLAVAAAVHWKAHAIALGAHASSAPASVPYVMSLLGESAALTVGPGPAGPAELTVSADAGWSRTLDVRQWGIGASSLFQALVRDSAPAAAEVAARSVNVQVIERKLLSSVLQYCGTKFTVGVLSPQQVRTARARRVRGRRRVDLDPRLPAPPAAAPCLPFLHSFISRLTISHN
jgi:propionyl-CoA carboxylase alpha chain